MELNKALSDLYKRRRESSGRRGSTRTNKRGGLEDNNENKNIPQTDDDQIDKKKARLDGLALDFEIEPETSFEALYGCDSARDQLLKIVHRFQRCLRGQALRSDWPVLICGSHGLGKTAIIHALAHYAKLKLVYIPLKDLIEHTRNEFKTVMNSFLKYCQSNQQRIVLFDDIDQVNDKEELRNILKSAVNRMLSPLNQLLVVCTTSSPLDVPKDLEFAFHIQLKRPDLESKFKILKSIRDRNNNLKSLDDEFLHSMSINTPSFTALDLKKMLDMAETESNGAPTKSDCDRALELMKQFFRKGTHLIGERPTITWDHIGGLPEVRRAFRDIMRSLRRGTINCKFAGIALHGPPGCGKTMVAQAMANEVGLNFISVKPAELIDKYLGETERNIRRVFSEAQEHEPCMIYFDEFDGLCGTRGNKDNITSAIQTLLSEMDGFVNRGKSIILASTNRLEDIDPAMKRPGRLSKHIYVGPPDESARKDILQVIIDRQSLVADISIDLGEWAKRTKNFSGADLDFLIAEAESNAISELKDCDDYPHRITIGRKHLEFAFESIKRTNMELSKKTDR